ncbi:MAG: NAD(P)-dependent oxidoreductase [Verrucomicrobiales bacterium]|jgi:3-hydroxyisobutyrate dehydrogenase|nr:NAD(P)-dependent oxidoreductase [Verrucomicrobiales bacterium]HQZ27934.1 NAD(P)-dependent oxidoreductase [Verrucomicrobiales bacterium]
MKKKTVQKKTATAAAPQARIGFVGVGRMGANMARHLHDLKYNVTAVFDVHKQSATDLATEIGATAYTKLADVTAHADIIFTVVTDDAAMKKIFLGKGDSLLTGAEGRTFINCATLSPEMQKTVSTAAKRKKADSIEACMASSISHARTGKLYLMIGADDAVFEKNKKLLEDLSLNLRHIGKIGKAAEVKALVNMVMNINTAGLAEGLGLAKSLGHDLKMICEVFSQTGANSRVLETDAEDMIAREHDCWFSAAHAAKDSGIAAGLAKTQKLSLPVNDATKAQYDKMIALGVGGLDKSGISELTFPGRTGNPKKKAAKKKVAKKAVKKTAQN